MLQRVARSCFQSLQKSSALPASSAGFSTFHEVRSTTATNPFIVNSVATQLHQSKPTTSMSLFENPLPMENDLFNNIMDCPSVLESDDIMEMIKREYQPSVLRRKRKFGFLKRMKSVGGRRVIKNRRMKDRKRLSA